METALLAFVVVCQCTVEKLDGAVEWYTAAVSM